MNKTARTILAYLKTIGIGAAEISEVEAAFAVDATRAKAMARDLGWTPAATAKRSTGAA